MELIKSTIVKFLSEENASVPSLERSCGVPSLSRIGGGARLAFHPPIPHSPDNLFSFIPITATHLCLTNSLIFNHQF